MAGLLGGGAPSGGGGRGGGSGNQGMGQFQFPPDPYAIPTSDAPAYDESSLFTNPEFTAPIDIGDGESTAPLLSQQAGINDIGGDQTNASQLAQTRSQQGGANPAGQTDETQGILSQLVKGLNPVTPAQAREPGSAWVTGGKPQQPIKWTSPEQYLGSTPKIPTAQPRPDLGNAYWENRQASQPQYNALGQPQDTPIEANPVTTTTTTPAEQPPAMPPLEPQAPPPAPEAPGVARTPAQSQTSPAATTAPAATTTPPVASLTQQPFNPLNIIGEILGLPGQLLSSLLGLSHQAGGQFGGQRGRQILSNLGHLLQGHPELMRHGDPQHPQMGAEHTYGYKVPAQQQATQQNPFPHRNDDLNYLTQRGGHQAGQGAVAFSPEMASRLRAAGEEYTRQTGQQPNFGQMSRSHALQQQYWDEYQRTGQGLAAPPGHSRHERGEAVDIPRGPFLDWMHRNASSFGLNYLTGSAYARDPVHTQMMAGFRGAPTTSGSAVAAAPRMNATRGERNNNPGNLKRGPNDAQFGVTRYDSQGHAIFPDFKSGLRAQAALLQRHYNNRTIPQIAREYTAIDQVNWARNVMRFTGHGSHDVLDLSNPAELDRLQRAIMRQEGVRAPQAAVEMPAWPSSE